MIRSNNGCDDTRVQMFLDDALPTQERNEFEDHLAECVSCRDLLQQVAASPDVWDKAKELLSDTSGEELENDQNDGRQILPAGVLDSLLPSDDPEMLGRIGEYEVSGIVGMGGMGAVLKGFDRSLRRVVAIKVMAPHLADSGSARSRFQREARAAAAITDDNIIDIYAVAENNGVPYIVMPFARGPSLQKRIDESGPLTTVEVVRIGRQISSGLSAAHDQGLVHRDIKPANILLNDGVERLWITDFGVARAIDDASMTQTGVIAGTPLYMSPEQARGETVDHRSDLFSLGSILYTACTGRPPFRSDSAYGILRRITDTDPRPIRELNPDIPEWLCRIIDRLLAKHPADRFQTADEVACLFESCLLHLQQPDEVALPPSITQGRVDGSEPESPGARSGVLDRVRSWPVVAALVLFGFFSLGLAALASQPKDIKGHWAGEKWHSINLSPAVEAAGWYSGSFSTVAGKQGVVHLEWSRWKRSYIGRWKIGDQQAGDITLRPGNGVKDVRGAISIDAESPAPTDVALPRDFVWQRAIGRHVATAEGASDRTRQIKSPVKGVITRVDPAVRVGAQVTKGQVLARIDPFDSSAYAEEQVNSLAGQVKRAEQTLANQERNADAMRLIVDALSAQLTKYEDVELKRKESNEAAARAAADVEMKQQEAIQARARYEEAEKQHNVSARVVENGLIPQRELAKLENQVKQAKSEVAIAKFRVQRAQEILREKTSLVASQSQSDKRNQLVVDLAKARADLVREEGDVDQARIALEQTKRKHSDAERKLNELDIVMIVSPFDGEIVEADSLYGSGTVKSGDVLCTIRVVELDPHDPATVIRRPTTSSKPDLTAKPSKRVEPPETRKALPRSTLAEFGTGSDLARRFRQADTASKEQKLELARQLLEASTNDLEVFEGKFDVIPGDNDKSRQEYDSQLTALREKRQVAQRRLVEMEQSVAEARALHEEASREKQTIIALLQSRLLANEEKLAIAEKNAAMMKFAFEQGRVSTDEFNKARNAVIEPRAELKEIQILLKHYEQLGRTRSEP